MRLASVLAAAAIVVSCGAGMVQAQTSDKIVPAEFPPASYKGRQYVDSRGCVFIRAGIDGAVTWVPRMTRSRKHICGAKPTLTAAARPAPAAAPAKSETASAPAPADTATPATARRKPAPASQKVVRAPAYRTSPAPVAAPAKPKAPAKTATKPDSKQVVKQVCQGASALSRQYINTSTGLSVRCGPQSAPHVTYREGARATAARPARAPARRTAPPVRVAPKHVYEKQLASTRNMYVPEGYEPVWKDGRLNPKRMHQTLAGKAQMELVWTNTVPRRLIVRETGQVVSRDQTGAALADLSTKGRAPASKSVANRSVASKPSAPAQEAVADSDPASHRYVQLGAFPDPDHALRAARRVANSGLPARMGDITRNGKDYKIVLAGPFETQARLMDGLRRVRGMGYGRAFLRK